MKSRICLGLLTLLLASCAGRAPLGGPGVQIVQSEGLPAPTDADLFGQTRPYRIGPLDKLTIDVFGISELNQKEVQADAGGRISFPLAGTVEVVGKTPGEVEELLEQRLRANYVRNPEVTVNLKQTVSQMVTVDGEVREPGLYPVMGRMTLVRAVATAKGTGEFAKLDDVVIFRTVNGQRMAALYNLQAIRRGNYADPEVYGNDVIVVGDSPARRLFRDILQTTSVLGYVAVALITN